MTAKHERDDDGYETLTLYGVVHKVVVMPADDRAVKGLGSRWPLMIEMTTSTGAEASALLSHDDIKALRSFLEPYEETAEEVIAREMDEQAKSLGVPENAEHAFVPGDGEMTYTDVCQHTGCGELLSVHEEGEPCCYPGFSTRGAHHAPDCQEA